MKLSVLSASSYVHFIGVTEHHRSLVRPQFQNATIVIGNALLHCTSSVLLLCVMSYLFKTIRVKSHWHWVKSHCLWPWSIWESGQAFHHRGSSCNLHLLLHIGSRGPKGGAVVYHTRCVQLSLCKRLNPNLLPSYNHLYVSIGLWWAGDSSESHLPY